MIADRQDCHLEQGRSKLLLGPVPKGLHTITELEFRLRLWHDGDFEALLARREAQVAACRNQTRRRTGTKSSRARQLVREGAYRKGVTALTGAMAMLTPSQEQLGGGTAAKKHIGTSGARRRQPTRSPTDRGGPRHGTREQATR